MYSLGEHSAPKELRATGKDAKGADLYGSLMCGEKRSKGEESEVEPSRAQGTGGVVTGNESNPQRPNDAEPDSKRHKPTPDAPAASKARFAISAAASEDKGRRNEMEDVWVITNDARGDTKATCRCMYAAVFDGHGGRRAADFAAQHLHANVLAAGMLSSVDEAGVAGVGTSKKAILEGFKRTDTALLEASTAANWQDGATAVCMWVVGNVVHLANVGDAKAVLARKQLPPTGGGTAPPSLRAITLSNEHKAIFGPERSRIEKAGGVVTDGRLQGRVEVSRSFGDRAFKRVGMSAVPDLRTFERKPQDAFVLMGCDGFWGVFGPQDAIDFVHKYLEEGRTAKAICNRILNEAIRERKCKDNCTVLLVVFTSN
uniref:protein-serine/threonine phosphatase n=1 Tax=Pyramimonas obovata TaxID=1411642 RepID=A0A7S0RWZ6_9CHLO|mmetsp:Transcript_8910/g.18474  ORF Transcript_8910/g.18474 Transcript_8910/m.18474 type:complete len:372 (+) Transcript_8910:145-1260(+)